jgi:hypothetical protein
LEKEIMDKTKVTQMFNSAKLLITKHSPEILTGVGIAGMITTTVLAVKATPKAMALIEEAERKKHVDIHGDYHDIGKEPLTKLEVVKAAWKPYVPAAITGVLSTTCLIGASATNYKRNAALATAYQVVSTTLADYKEQVVETIGEKREKTIREKVAQKQVDRMPENSQQQVIVTGYGDVWFIDPVSNQEFQSDIERVRKTFNDLNYRMVTGMEEYISLSELYDELGIPRTSVSDDIGWNLGKDGQIEFTMHACTRRNGQPALMLEYLVAPRRGFTNLM